VAATAFVADRAGTPAGLVGGAVLQAVVDGHEARAVAALGHELGLDPVLMLPVTVGSAGGPEAAARDARYAALDAAAQALDAVLLLAHTLDDQAETVLLGLGRGSGARSLAGMRTVDGHRRRPLLGVRRAQTRQACADLGLPVWDDPHNLDPAFRRVRVRHEALPLLEDVLGGGVAAALARTAGQLTDDADALDEWAARIPVGDTVEVAALLALPRAVRTRVLRQWADHAGAGVLTAERTAALDDLVTAWRGQGPVELPGGVRVRRASGTLALVTGPAA
jgi:tRNA(Ile)-lysidine synthase